MANSYQPPAESISFRSNLARLLSPLRRVRPRVPFFRLAAHRLPTLWSLYRGLLRKSPSEEIRSRVKFVFRKNRHLTGTGRTIKLLLQGYKFLHTFCLANSGSSRHQLLLARYSSLLRTRSFKSHWRALARAELSWRARLASRPILTGGFLRPSRANPPLPRLRPQPLDLTMIIKKRRLVHERRVLKLATIREAMEDVKREAESERKLMQELGHEAFEPEFFNKTKDWLEPLQRQMRHVHSMLAKEEERKNLRYAPEMLAAIRAARREKIVNKTRERERESRGEVLRATVLRRRKGPPAHVLAGMSPEQRSLDKISRSVSEVGYVAMVKRRLGFKLKNPNAWKAENEGKTMSKKELDRLATEIKNESERRISEQEELL